MSSEYAPVNHVGEFLSSIPRSARVVEFGSGNRRLRETVLNMDLFPLPNVDIVADIHHVPLSSSSIDYAILESVVEHVPEPQRVIDEIHRVLKPGGKLLCIAPFIIPYHGYPAHYQNFSRDGLAYLMKYFSSCSIRTQMGPTSAVINIISEYFALACSGKSKIGYVITKGLALLPIFYLKLLDKFWINSTKSQRMAFLLCSIAVK